MGQVAAGEVIPMVVEVEVVAGLAGPTRMVAANIMTSLETIIRGAITIGEEAAEVQVETPIVTMDQGFKLVMLPLKLGWVREPSLSNFSLFFFFFFLKLVVGFLKSLLLGVYRMFDVGGWGKCLLFYFFNLFMEHDMDMGCC